MGDPSKEFIGVQLAKAVAQRSAALDVLRENPRRMGFAQYVASVIGVAIPGSYFGNITGTNGGWILGAAIGCALALGIQAVGESYRLRKRVDAAITILLQDAERGA